MHVERQGLNECMLATIAAVAMRPLAEVRGIACKHANVRRWTKAQGFRYWDAVDYTARLLGGAALAALVSQTKGGYGSIEGSVEKVQELPAKGRGIVRFGNKRGGAGHICPWQDGLIHDPSDPDDLRTRGLALSNYLAKNPKLYLRAIRSIAFEGSPEDNPNPTSPDMGY